MNAVQSKSTLRGVRELKLDTLMERVMNGVRCLINASALTLIGGLLENGGRRHCLRSHESHK